MADVKKFIFFDQDGQMAEQKATDTIQVANGVNSLDAVNKGQLDSAVGSLTDLINAEAARAAQAEAALGDSITAEQTARIAADAALSASLVSETNARQAADTALGGRIDAEEAARAAADTAEASARAAADTALRNDLDAEIAARAAAITAEQSARSNADASLQSQIDALSASSSTALTSAINSLTADLAAETSARTSADAALQSSLDAEIARATAAESAEAAARTAADNTLTADLASEISRAVAAEGVLTAAVAAEASRAQAAEQDLADDIAAEQSRAQTAEGAITTALNAEITRATAAEAELTSDLAAEIARATASEIAKLQEAKDYADARVQGLSWKASVDYAFPRETGGFTLPADAAAFSADFGLVAGNRVLLYSNDQMAHADNGIYVVAAGGTFTRAADMAAGKDAAGAVVYVETSTSAGAAPGSSFVCANEGTAIVGTDALMFVIFSRAENLSFADGVQKVGTAVSLKLSEGKPFFIDNGALSFNVDGVLGFNGETGALKITGSLVGGPFVNADDMHAHPSLAVTIPTSASTGTAVLSDGTATTYDSSYFRGVVDAREGSVGRVVTHGACTTAFGALASFAVDEIVYLGSAPGVFCKFADIPSGKWAVPVGTKVEDSLLNVNRMPAAFKA